MKAIESSLSDATRPGWNRVPAAHRAGLEAAVATMARMLGSNLLSVTFYGEVVTGGFVPKVHGARSVAVLEKVEPASLRRLAAEGMRLAKSDMAAPVVVTPSYIRDSLDTFPLEWLEIQQQGATVLGLDHFLRLVLESEAVRLQCEREIKSLLMGLRFGLLAAGGRERAVPLIEQEAADRLLRTLRGMIWLRGTREYLPAGTVVSEVEKLMGERLDGLRSSLDPLARHDWTEFDRLYGEVERLMGKAESI
jgi:hypothetical protein